MWFYVEFDVCGKTCGMHIRAINAQAARDSVFREYDEATILSVTQE